MPKPNPVWSPIATAPRDGTYVCVAAVDDGEGPPEFTDGPYLMRWDAKGVNPLVGDVVGLWVAVGGTFTWDESRGAGPTHWTRDLANVH